MDKTYIYKHLISSLYKMLCWREEKRSGKQYMKNF